MGGEAPRSLRRWNYWIQGSGREINCRKEERMRAVKNKSVGMEVCVWGGNRKLMGLQHALIFTVK